VTPRPRPRDLAQPLGETREALLEHRFADLNSEFGVLPSRSDPQQQRFAHGRERGLALGTRVHLAEARENTSSPELVAWEIRQRALRASDRAQQRPTAQRQTADRATEIGRHGAQRAQARQRAGVER
jgi:hypothetical protein